jgi:mRNA interferase MazF
LTLIPVSRGDIFWVDSGRTIGSEIRKRRPWVVIQNDIANLNSSVVIIAAITSNTRYRDHPVNVFVTASETGLEKDSLVLCNQIKTVDKSRLLERIGKMPAAKMYLVDWALLRSLDIDYTYEATPPKG